MASHSRYAAAHVVIAAFVLFTVAPNAVRASTAINVPSHFSAQFAISPLHTDYPNAMAYKGTVHVHDDWALQLQVDAVSLGSDAAPQRFLYNNDDLYLLSHRTTCLPRSQYPPFHELKDALAQAVPLSGSVIPRLEHCQGNLWTVPFAGREYVVCTNEAGVPRTIYGEEFTLHISAIKELQSDAALNDFGAALKSVKCPMSAPYSVHHKKPAQTHKWYLGEAPKPLRALRAEDKRVCIFLHGSGVQHDEPTSDSFPDYWGVMGNFTPQCSERRFIHKDTWSRGWTSAYLQQAFCDVALDNDGSTVISNKIMFSHSMGNLIMAGAIYNGLCKIDTTTTSWYAVQAPINGSKGCTVLELLCNSTDMTIRKILNELSYCNGTGGSTVVAYTSMVPGYPGLDKLEGVLEANTKGRLCGTSAWGLSTAYSVALTAIADVVQYGELNDGMVAISSCSESVNSHDFQPDYHADYYVPAVNHADGTCRNGNGWWGLERDPCSWYQYRGINGTAVAM